MWMVQYVIIIYFIIVRTFAHQTCYLKLSFLFMTIVFIIQQCYYKD